MAKPTKIVLPNTVKPKVWVQRDLYQEYAAFILKSDPQCWGKYNKAAKRKNYWIYKTVGEGTKKRIVEVMNYKRWVAIITQYFQAAKRYIILDGKALSMGHLGRIAARRCERNFDKPVVNQYETAKQPKVRRESDGKMVPAMIIYFTSDDYLKIGWVKYHRFTNESMYRFVPTDGDLRKGGFKDEFARANQQDPLLKFKYEYFPRHRVRRRDKNNAA